MISAATMSALDEKPIDSKGGEDSAYVHQETAGEHVFEVKLKRQLKNRHIAMISIGGVLVPFVSYIDSVRGSNLLALVLDYS